MSLTSTLILKRPNLFKVYILHHSFNHTAPMQAILRSICFVCTHGAFHIVLFDCQDSGYNNILNEISNMISQNIIFNE